MNQRSISFTKEQETLLKKESTQTGVSVAGLVRLAVNQYLKEAY